jgi:hypothetical protein
MTGNPASNPFSNTGLPSLGQTIIVRRHDSGKIVHLWGEVVEVYRDEGRVSIEQPPGVYRYLWFPENEAVWREAVQ